MYIRSYENYKKHSKINEEFLGKMFKKLGKKIKSKVAVGLSKKLGSAKDVEKIMDEYKSELKGLSEEKKQKLKAIAELEKSKAEGGDVSDKIDKAVKAYKKAEEIYEKQKDNLKEKFDLKFNEIVKEEDNPVIKNYIKLKKIDMVSEMLQQEMNDLNEEMGIDKETFESSDILQNIIKSSNEELQKVNDMRKNVEEETKKQMENEGKGEDEGEGNEDDGSFEPGREVRYKNEDGDEIETVISSEDYQKDTKDEEISVDRKFNPGDKIEYKYDDGNKDGKAEISDNQESTTSSELKDGQIRVKTENSPDGIRIYKDQIDNFRKVINKDQIINDNDNK